MEFLKSMIDTLPEPVVSGGLQRRFPDRDFFKPHNRKPKLQRKGTRDRRITVVKIVDGREHYYHVTKGWRTRRA